MNTYSDSNTLNPGPYVANKAADKVKNGIADAASNFSNKVDSARQQGKQIMDQAGDAVGVIRDTASDAADSLVTYTKDNPVKALLMAAGVGILFLTVIQALTLSRR